MPAAGLLKHLTLRLLPESLLQHLRKAHYARKLRRAEPEPEMRVIPRLLPAGGCALDLGANFGLYTRLLAETVGPAGAVHAVEPVPGTCDVLRSNVRRLGLVAVTVHNVAVSDRAGAVTMTIPRYARGGENLYEARITADEGPGEFRLVVVPAESLDELFGGLGRIDFVKCDVEGHELSVLRGAEHILREHRPAWLMEVSGDPDDPVSPAADVVGRMREAGYLPYHIRDGAVRRREPGDRATNYFFLRPEHVKKVTGMGLW